MYATFKVVYTFSPIARSSFRDNRYVTGAAGNNSFPIHPLFAGILSLYMR